MDVLAAIVAVSIAIVKAIDLIRRFVPAIDGPYVPAVASALGVAIAFATGLQGIDALWALTELPPLAVTIPAAVDSLITGVVLGLGSGYFSDLRPEKAPSPTVEVNLREIEPE